MSFVAAKDGNGEAPARGTAIDDIPILVEVLVVGTARGFFDHDPGFADTGGGGRTRRPVGPRMATG